MKLTQALSLALPCALAIALWCSPALAKPSAVKIWFGDSGAASMNMPTHDLTIGIGMATSAFERVLPAEEVTFNVANSSKALVHETVVSLVTGEKAAVPYGKKGMKPDDDTAGNLGEGTGLEPGKTGAITLPVRPGVNWHSTQLHRTKYSEEIELAAREFALDPALVRAIIHAESGFNALARSPKGAVGLMQLMPATARMLGVTDIHLPRLNIRGGVQYLASLLARFKNDVGLAAAAYNAGPEAVKKHAGVPPFAETQDYVQRVKILLQRYRSTPAV